MTSSRMQGAGSRSQKTLDQLKEYHRPEIRRYGRVSHAVFGGSGKKIETAPGGGAENKGPRP